MRKLSVRNSIEGTVASVTMGKVMSEVVVETLVGHLASVITTRSVKQMKLKPGVKVHFMIKATEAFILRDKQEGEAS